MAEPALTVIRRVLTVVREGQPPSLQELARTLDELAVSVHGVPEGDPADSEAEPPAGGYPATYARLGARFPDLGFYPVVDPLGDVDTEHALGDAIDDLADIVQDLDELCWRFENLGRDDAHWHLHLLYRSHWGRHLRDLSSYLHAMQFG